MEASDLSAPARNLWYMCDFSANIRLGQLRHHVLLGEPIVLGRTRSGDIFALRDICPHRAVPLSKGRLTSDNRIECPYHGWRFGTDGACVEIPSLAPGQSFETERICVRKYDVIEQDGLIWVYMPAGDETTSRSKVFPPKVDSMDTKPRWKEKQTFHCSIDHAVIGLMDPVHAAFVHRHWWWHRPIRLKKKHYAPLSHGFVMTRHRPTKPAYGLLGDVTTEITFELPSTRLETVTGNLFGRAFRLISLTVCTPRDLDHTDVFQVFYWPSWLSFILPIFWLVGRTFIADDRRIVESQREGLHYSKSLMLIPDADQPAIWYHRIKKAWIESLVGGERFTNPMQERTVWWRS